MQIYNGNFNFYGVSAETIFDPCTNIKIGADILTKSYLAKKEEMNKRTF
ncbi:transglycosylase SLT domain-containing protein [Escherichia coli]|nr:transglycosylase SLT domain-containing protein [Escherichia coli]